MEKIYKVKEGFVLREIGGSYCVVAVGALSNTFKGIITLNATGAYLFKILIKGATKEELVTLLLDEFEVEKMQALRDVETFLQKIEEGGLLE